SKPIYGFLISLVVIGVLIYYLLWGMFRFLEAYNRKEQKPVSPLVTAEQDTRMIVPGAVQRFPEPRLETDERTEINDFRLQEEQTLNSFGWVDQNAGVVRIPITRAMELIAQRGLPTTPQAGTAPASPVNLARQAAEKSDTSMAPAAPEKQNKGKKK
ncbi:MAG TPA: hypothetical protein VFB00_03215, partial [Terriglobales bacterium]|nr:hypothetical protein [Terriglobales bacterium]